AGSKLSNLSPRVLIVKATHLIIGCTARPDKSCKDLYGRDVRGSFNILREVCSAGGTQTSFMIEEPSRRVDWCVLPQCSQPWLPHSLICRGHIGQSLTNHPCHVQRRRTKGARMRRLPHGVP